MEQIYNTLINRLIKKNDKLGFGTYNTFLDKIGSQLFGRHWLGVFPQDKLDDVERGSYAIINVDGSDEQGSHWMAICRKYGRRIYVYDSFGRPSSEIIPILYEKLKKKGYRVVDADYDPEQTSDEENCGVRCISFLLCVKYYGVRKSLTI